MYLLLRANQRPKQNHKDVLLPAHQQKLYPLEKNVDRFSARRVFVIYLEKMERLNSGDQIMIFDTILCDLNIGPMEEYNGKKVGGNKKRFQYFTDPSGQELYLRALEGHSRRNLITRQCVNSERFLRVHLSHRMYNHSIMNS